MSGTRRLAITWGGLPVLAAAVALIMPAPAAWAGHGVTLHASTGPGDSNGANDASSERISEDGSRAFFTTREQLVPEDQDGMSDIYEYHAGAVRLISTGPTDPGNTGSGGTLQAMSFDGTRVFFATAQSLVSNDTDSRLDLYERHGEVTTLVSTGDVGGNGAYDVCIDPCPVVATPDGSHVFFFTAERLVAADIDTDKRDLYERTGGVTRLASTGPNDGPVQGDAGCCSVFASDDGEHVAFASNVSHVPEGSGLFVRSHGTSTARVPTDGLDPLRLAGLSHDGSRVWFIAYPTDDADWNCFDEFETPEPCEGLYEYSGGTLRTLGDHGNTRFYGATPDGSVFFSMDCGDQYTQPGCPYALFRHRAGSRSGISADGFFVGASDDGERVFFMTTQALVPEDTDSCATFEGGCFDVYERSGGTYTLISTGPTATGTSAPADGLRASPDGARVVFTTSERLVAEDTDSSRDTYLRTGGATTLLSHGPAGGNGPHDANPTIPGARTRVSRDAARVVFLTRERLSFSDTDVSLDAYVAGPADASGYPRPKSARANKVSLVPAYQPCTAPNREHGPPLAFGSCAPPAPASSHLMVGVGDGHPSFARSVGFARLKVRPGVPGGGDDTTGRLRVSLTNVMRTADLSEYTGELRASVWVRITDSEGTVSQTSRDLPLELTVPCLPTPDAPGTASVCDLGTDLDAVLPGATPEGTRAIWQLDQVKVYDGGPDEDADTAGDNELFAVQGVFVP